jgi:hypothetical protein
MCSRTLLSALPSGAPSFPRGRQTPAPWSLRRRCASLPSQDVPSRSMRSWMLSSNWIAGRWRNPDTRQSLVAYRLRKHPYGQQSLRAAARTLLAPGGLGMGSPRRRFTTACLIAHPCCSSMFGRTTTCHRFPGLQGFLLYWNRHIEGKVHSVRVAHQHLIGHAEWRVVDGVLRIH